MLKSTLSIVAFTLTFGFSVVLIGLLFGFPQPSYDYPQKAQSKCFDQTAHEIERLISQDERNGTARNSSIVRMDLSHQDPSAISKYSRSVSRYVQKSSSINDSNLPSDFREAWQSHMNAWANYSEFLNERRDSKSKMSDEGFNSVETRLDKEISRTWIETLRIAKAYGANH